MRCGPHVMASLTPGTPARAIYERWVTTVRPPVVKWCRQSFDSQLMAWTRAQGCKNVGRWVEGDVDEPGRTLNELLQFAGVLDFVEFANEEEQGKDNPREWDRLMDGCLAFMQDLDKRNRAAGRTGPKACIANTSVGQPEIERWTRTSTMEVARYAAANGHVWGVHSYYKPEPWAMVEGGKAAWDGTPPAVGWLMLREVQAVKIMRAAGIAFRFIVTESGRDNIPGQPGPGGGFRDVPSEPFAEYMRQYGRHLSALPECVGWVDFGFNAWEGWKQFDLTLDPAMADKVIAAMTTLPRGGGTGGTVTTVETAALEAARARQAIQLNPAALLQKFIAGAGYWPTSGEFDFAVAGEAFIGQRAEHPTTGDVRVYYAPKPAYTPVKYVTRPKA